MNRKGLVLKYAIGLIILIPLVLFGFFLINNVVGGSGTDQSAARATASDLALVLSDFELKDSASFRAELPTEFWLNVSLEENKIRVYEGNALDETYAFSKPKDAKRICCPKKKDVEKRACSTFCPDSLILGLNKEVSEDMKVASYGTTIWVNPVY